MRSGVSRLASLSNQIGQFRHQHTAWKNQIYKSARRAFSTSKNHQVNNNADDTKAEEESPKQINVFNAGIFMNPHFEKRKKGGEDAATITLNLLAVADGVGGWASSGIDPAIYSRRLCNLIGEIAEKADDRHLMNPREVIIEACD
jgi:hypothetical protein